MILFLAFVLLIEPALLDLSAMSNLAILLPEVAHVLPNLVPLVAFFDMSMKDPSDLSDGRFDGP